VAPRTGILICSLAISLTVTGGQIRVASLVELEGNPNGASLSPDGKTLAFNWCKPGGVCGLYTRPLKGGEARLLAGKDSHGRFPTGVARWSPDGRRIAFLRGDSDSRLLVHDTASGSERDLGAICEIGNWSPDGRFLVAGTPLTNAPQGADCRPTLFSAETGMRTRSFAARGEGAVFSPDGSPDGKKLVYYDGSKLMLLRLTADLRPDGAAATLVEDPDRIADAMWTANGSEIVFQTSGDVSKLYRVSPQPGASPRLIPGIPSNLSFSQLLSDGGALATESNSAQRYWRFDFQSTPPRLDTVDGLDCSLRGTGCSPDGHRRAFALGYPPIFQSEVWTENMDGTDRQILVKPVPAFVDPKDDGVVRVVGWSPDGKWIAYTVTPTHWARDPRAYLYVVPASGGTARRVGPEALALEHTTWSQDGKSLYAVRRWPPDDAANGKRSAIVRIDAPEGTLTELGDGDWPRESPDGRFLYFFAGSAGKLSRISIDTGAVTPLRNQSDLEGGSFAIGSRYVYAIQRMRGDGARGLRMIQMDPVTGVVAASAGISTSAGTAHVSPDERFLYFERETVQRQRVVVVHGVF